ncbi:MAG: hypothetical protein CVU43_22325 [Chloroflexi bacterium HGW-Chloroflexi-5]|nr:MAG: hypothetical protein CVU54_16565 [Deltaproteobacteria bacterium HGW-Deltaproteobacteria-12]PKN96125.1 MAG: hypothetical protein CVU43_22325 [Chloroflexi bacterium HGW-Chloroflexi-5]
MRNLKRVVFFPVFMAIIFFSWMPATAQYETIRGIELNDGTVISGRIIKMSNSEVTVEAKDGKTSTYKFDDVKSIIKEGQDETVPAAAKAIPEGQPEKTTPSIVPKSHHAWTIGPEISAIEYKEPDVMKEKGMMSGIAAAYTYSDKVMLKADAKLSYGQVDYSNSGTIDNIDDYMMEIRGVGGYNFKLTETMMITPFFGFGFRYLRDELNGRISSTGAKGYLRETNYVYSPIGVTVLNNFNNSWVLGLTVEFDFFWRGRQKSRLSDVDPAYSNLENNQDGGYGLRGSLLIKKIVGRMSYSLEPFIKYWNIDKSDIQNITYNGALWGSGWEPQNNSTEVGLKFSVGF